MRDRKTGLEKNGEIGKTKNNRKQALDDLCTEEEMANFFGVELKTIWDWRKTLGLPHVHLGRQVFYLQNDVMDWLKKKTHQDTTE